MGKAAAEHLDIEKITAEDAQPDTTADDATPGDPETDARTEPVPAEYWLSWVQRCEQAIAQILQKTTLAANELLQKLGILPERLPVGALEVAARARETGTPNAANLSEITVELRTKPKDDEEETEGEMVTAADRAVAVGRPRTGRSDPSGTASSPSGARPELRGIGNQISARDPGAGDRPSRTSLAY